MKFSSERIAPGAVHRIRITSWAGGFRASLPGAARE